MKTVSLAILVLFTAACVGWMSVAVVLAGEGESRCACCGCSCACQKICRLVKEEKKVEIVCWGCKHEDFCLPGPNHKCDEHCECVCDDPKICTKPKSFIWYDWIPGCPTMQTRTKLMKKTITKKIPSFKYVVEDLCDKCQEKHQEEIKAAELPATNR